MKGPDFVVVVVRVFPLDVDEVIRVLPILVEVDTVVFVLAPPPEEVVIRVLPILVVDVVRVPAFPVRNVYFVN